MKWFKHHASLRNTEAVVRFVDATGLEGYGFLCITLEMIAENMGPQDQRCELCLSLRRWSTAIGIHRNKVIKYASTLRSTGLATITRDGSDLRVQMPILAEWRDEYSKKSGHTQEPVRTNSSQSRSEQRRTDQRQGSGSLDVSKGDGSGERSGKGFESLSSGLQEVFKDKLKESA